MVVRQVSYGKVHYFNDGPLWKRLTQRLPTKVASALGIKLRPTVTPRDTLVIWIETTGPAPMLSLNQWLRIVDTNGLATPLVYISNQQLGSNRVVHSFQFTTFPRRQPELLFELHRGTGASGDHLADFRIKNPAWLEGSEGAQSRLPSVAEVHGERFELIGFNTGLSATGTLARTHFGQWTELIFRIGTNEPATLSTNLNPSGPWSIRSVTLHDSDGTSYTRERSPQGRVIPMGDQFMSRFDDGIALVRGAVWPDQLWTIRAYFQRRLTPTLGTNWQWTVSIPLPAKGETVILEQTAEVLGRRIELVSLAPHPPDAPDRYANFQGAMRLRVNFKGANTADELRVARMTDQDGETISGGRMLVLGKNGRHFELQPNPQSKRVTITFAVLPRIHVEFQARPTILRTNVARWAAPNSTNHSALSTETR